MWDSVRGSTLATLFRLAQTWDLYLLLDCSLKNGVHSLVSFIHDQHSMQRELLLRPEPSPEPTFEELAQGLEEMSSLVDRLPADTRRNDDREFIDLRCTRCERRINTVSPPLLTTCLQCILNYMYIGVNACWTAHTQCML